MCLQCASFVKFYLILHRLYICVPFPTLNTSKKVGGGWGQRRVWHKILREWIQDQKWYFRIVSQIAVPVTFEWNAALFLLPERMPHSDRTPQGRQHLSPMSQRFSHRGRSYNDVPYRVRFWICTLFSATVQFRHCQSQLYSLKKKKKKSFHEDILMKRKDTAKYKLRKHTFSRYNCNEKLIEKKWKFIKTCNACAGTLNIIASLKIGLFSPFFTDVFFLCIFFPCWSRYTFRQKDNKYW